MSTAVRPEFSELAELYVRIYTGQGGVNICAGLGGAEGASGSRYWM